MSALLALWVCAAGAAVPTPPPAPKPEVGAFEPFDLKYLSRTNSSLLAVRPNEVLKQLGSQDKVVGDLVRRTLAAAFAFIDGDLKAAAPPALADIDQLVLSTQFTLAVETTPDGRGNWGANAISSGSVRTAKPFDWAKCVSKWFPKGERVEHAGREYVRVPIEIGKDKLHLALYAADDRTLVFDTDEDEIKGLLSRLDKKMTAAVPAGWDEVSRDLLALWHDTTADGWLTAPARPKRDVDRAIVTALRGTTAVALGFSAGDRTVLRAVVTTRDASTASKVRTALAGFVTCVATDENTEPTAAKFLAETDVTRDGKRVRVKGSVPGNLLRGLLDPDAER